MSEINLFHNTNPLSLPVNLSNGKNIMMSVQPGEAFFDKKGYVRLFSMKFDNGEIGNFKLLPNNQSPNQALSLVRQFIIPFGLGILSGEIIEEVDDTIIDNIGRFLFNKFGNFVANDIFDSYSIANSSYYEMTTGELVITKCIRLNVT